MTDQKPIPDAVQSTDAPTPSPAAESKPESPRHVPELRAIEPPSREATLAGSAIKWALIVGAVGVLCGVLKAGALSVVFGNLDAEGLLVHGLVFGFFSAILGAAAGAFDWWLAQRKKTKSRKSGR